MPTNFCECGCGQVVKEGNRFISGSHVLRVNRGSRKGAHLSAKTKMKISESLKGKHPPEEARRRMGEAHKGIPFSEEHRRKISLALRGIKRTDETKRKYSKAKKGKNHPWYGKHLPAVTRRKIGDSNKGKHHSIKARIKIKEAKKGQHYSKEARGRMSEAHKGIYHTPETRRKLSELNKGKRLSAETRGKISEFKRGKPTWMKGRHHSEKSIRLISKANKGKKMSLDFRRKQSERMLMLGAKHPLRIFAREHPDRVRENSRKAALASLASQRQNSPYYLDNVPFDSNEERQAMLIISERFNITPIEGVNCHVRVNGGEVDFRPTENLFIEYHPWDRKLSEGQYYENRRKLLDENGFRDCRLIVAKSLEEVKGLVMA